MQPHSNPAAGRTSLYMLIEAISLLFSLLDADWLSSLHSVKQCSIITMCFFKPAGLAGLLAAGLLCCPYNYNNNDE